MTTADVYAYGPVDRLNTIRRNGVSWRSYAYDSAGRPSSITEGSWTRTFTWDTRDKLLGSAVGGVADMAATYNAFGTRVSRDAQVFRRLSPGVTSPVISDGVRSYDPGGCGD